MQTFKAYHFDGRISNPRPVTLEVENGNICIKELGLTYLVKNVNIRVKLKNTPQTISFEDGSYCELSAQDTFIADDDKNSRLLLKIESKIRYSLTAFAILAALTAFTLTIGSTFIAGFISNAIPQSVSNKLSDATLKFLEKHYFEPSKLDAIKRKEIERRFAKISGNNKLHFYSSSILGANAFALPSGDIILLDELIELEKDGEYRGIIAVLAHECGHVVHKHGLKTIVKSSITSALVGYLMGDFSGLMTSAATFAIDAKYSRTFESEADQYAITIMNENNISMRYLADIFESMDNTTSNEAEKLFSTHPSMDERIKKFREN